MEGYHTLLSISLLCIIYYVYLTYSTYDVKLKCIIISFLYSITEFTWIGSTIELPNGEIKFKPFDKNCRKPHTTIAQFLANVLLLPFFFTLYPLLLNSSVLRVILFPLFIWSLEIIEGYVLIFMFGKNIAWTYSGYFKLWLILGVFYEILTNQLIN